jgi:hypothetical protein
MTFKHVEANGNYRSVRLLSVGGKWELGLSPYTYGMRVRMGRTGYLPQVMDFCLGTEPALFLKVLMAVLERLKVLDENATHEAVDAVFPWTGTRPDMSVHLKDLLETQVQ